MFSIWTHIHPYDIMSVLRNFIMPVHKTEELYVYEHTVLLMNGAAEQRLTDASAVRRQMLQRMGEVNKNGSETADYGIRG